jgi:hypothetical protein
MEEGETHRQRQRDRETQRPRDKNLLMVGGEGYSPKSPHWSHSLRTGDHIVMVNGVSVENVTSAFAIQILKTCTKTANVVSGKRLGTRILLLLLLLLHRHCLWTHQKRASDPIKDGCCE